MFLLVLAENTLRIISERYGSGYFQTKGFKDVLLSESTKIGSLEKYDIKRTYRHVDRLYRMGFLRKKRVKRRVMLSTGQTRYRGFEHFYSLSNRGKKYLNYLDNPDAEKKSLLSFRDVADAMQIQYLENLLPERMKGQAARIYRDIFPPKRSISIEQRFPRQDSALILTLRLLVNENRELKRQLSERKASLV
jgi:hypothetical protein